MNLTVIGTGYVGLVAGACFADTGHDVICVDKDQAKINGLKEGKIPIFEPGLSDIVRRNTESGQISFTTDLDAAVKASDVIFIAVGTPQDEDGSADLTHVLSVAKAIGAAMNGPKVVVTKSTVPVGTGAKVRAAIESVTKHPVDIVSNPEFLKEGAAIDDFMRPDRVVVGVSSEKAAAVMKEIYAPFVRNNHPVLVMDIQSAEMTKYAANAMLAARVSFMNEIANLCERVGADVNLVRVGMGTDDRIGMRFLYPGLGYGGSCFPKDVQALIRTAKDHGVDLYLSKATETVNANQKRTLFEKAAKQFGGKGALKGKVFAVWGLAFKPQTDDVREAPSAVLIKELSENGAKILAHDPEAVKSFQQVYGAIPGVSYVKNQYEALDKADALFICTEWNTYRRPNFDKMKSLMSGNVIFDGRNLYEADRMRTCGFVYHSVGRPVVE